MSYILMTDSDSDMPYEIKEKLNIPMVYMPYTLNGKEYFDDLGQTIDHKSYYDAMRNGAMPSTSALNEENYLEYFEPILKEQDLLFIAFSSKLSCTIQAVYSAREKLLKKYPERTFIVVDTLSISAPQTLLVYKAHELYANGASIETVAKWLEDNKLHSQAWFAVDDLKYLKRGGRVSPAAAAFGSMLDIKPLLTESREGTLIPADKIRGKKKALSALVDRTMENHPAPDCPIMIIHADVEAEATALRDLVKQKLPDAEVWIYPIGPVIGAHAGPGTMAICFIGDERPLSDPAIEK